jgi:microcystin-dependent protein
MSDPFIGEIKLFAGNFAPSGWALCNGQLLPIAQYSAVFAVLGITYGGDGKTNFALPNLQARAPLQQGHGPGLSQYTLGQSGGAATVTLLQSQIPAHVHPLKASTAAGNQSDPNGMAWAMSGAGRGVSLYTAAQQDAQMHPNSLSASGGGLPHNNLMPYLPLTFIIALMGLFPTRP